MGRREDAALMTGTDPKISTSNLDRIRQLCSEIRCFETHAVPISDAGFHGPGQKRLLASLDSYQPGTPRTPRTCRDQVAASQACTHPLPRFSYEPVALGDHAKRLCTDVSPETSSARQTAVERQAGIQG